MATALTPSEEKANYFRLASLLIDGGKLALKAQFDQHCPPATLQQHLNKQATIEKLQSLKKDHVFNRSQEDLLYPKGRPPDSATFDVTLLALLLTKICGLTEPVTGWFNPPISSDTSVEADIVRLRIYRNELQHRPGTLVPSLEFQTKWQSVEQVISRLGSGILGLKERIHSLHDDCIDPAKEALYKRRLQRWEDLDRQLIQDVERLKVTSQATTSRLAGMERALQTAGTERSALRDQVTALQDSQTEHGEGVRVAREEQRRQQDVQRESEKKIDENTKRITDVEDRMNEAAGTRFSTELQSLRSATKFYLSDSNKETFVETSSFLKAKEALKKSNILVLSGSPGEGKTTVAVNLMLSTWDPERCLLIRHPKEWDYIDWKLKAFKAVLIDDIFGAGNLNKEWLEIWSPRIDALVKIAKKANVHFLITTRHYILEECKPTLQKYDVFKSENVHILSSLDLLYKEKQEILKVHLKRDNRETVDSIIRESLLFHLNPFERMGIHSRVPFGFPECVSLFTKSDILFSKGARFFKSPEQFFRTFIHELSSVEEKFLALLIIWARGSVTKSELQEKAGVIKSIASAFGFEFNSNLARHAQKYLECHKDGLLTYSEGDGSYRFSHNVIRDMVGLVASEEYPKATIMFASKEFFMEYITTDKNVPGERFYVEPYLYPTLSSRIVRLLREPQKRSFAMHDQVRVHLFGHIIAFAPELDCTMVMHSVFRNQKFAKSFIDYLSEQSDTVQTDVLGTDCISFAGKLQPYGIDMTDVKLNLVGASLLFNNHTLAKEYLRSQLPQKPEVLEAGTRYASASLLCAVAECDAETVGLLLKAGAVVTGNVLYVATSNLGVIETLLNTKGTNPNERASGVNGNTALHSAAKQGKLDVVNSLLAHKADPGIENDTGRRALDKAILMGEEEVSETLIKGGAPTDYKCGKLMRTPMHVAADKGQALTVQSLLQAGASARIADKKGQYAIHCAAMRGRASVVRVLLEHDKAQVNIRATAYGRKSMVRGMTPLHYAARNGFCDVLDVLLEEDIDLNVRNSFGHTAAYIASSFGHKEFLENLNGKAADLSQAEKQGYTPLHAAVFRKQKEIAELLCASPSVDVNAQDKFGNTPLHVAAVKGFADIGHILIIHGADLRMKNKQGLTALARVSKKARAADIYLDEFLGPADMPGDRQLLLELLEIEGPLESNDPSHKT